MNKDAIVVQVTSMIQENPIEITCGAETHDGGIANLAAKDKQASIGMLKSYIRSVWIIKDEWTTLPADEETVTIGGEILRILGHRDYYLDFARRLDLGARYELGRGLE